MKPFVLSALCLLALPLNVAMAQTAPAHNPDAELDLVFISPQQQGQLAPINGGSSIYYDAEGWYAFTLPENGTSRENGDKRAFDFTAGGVSTNCQVTRNPEPSLASYSATALQAALPGMFYETNSHEKLMRQSGTIAERSYFALESGKGKTALKAAYWSLKRNGDGLEATYAAVPLPKGILGIACNGGSADSRAVIAARLRVGTGALINPPPAPAAQVAALAAPRLPAPAPAPARGQMAQTFAVAIGLPGTVRGVVEYEVNRYGMLLGTAFYSDTGTIDTVTAQTLGTMNGIEGLYNARRIISGRVSTSILKVTKFFHHPTAGLDFYDFQWDLGNNKAFLSMKGSALMGTVGTDTIGVVTLDPGRPIQFIMMNRASNGVSIDEAYTMDGTTFLGTHRAIPMNPAVASPLTVTVSAKGSSYELMLSDGRVGIAIPVLEHTPPGALEEQQRLAAEQQRKAAADAQYAPIRAQADGLLGASRFQEAADTAQALPVDEWAQYIFRWRTAPVEVYQRAIDRLTDAQRIAREKGGEFDGGQVLAALERRRNSLNSCQSSYGVQARPSSKWESASPTQRFLDMNEKRPAAINSYRPGRNERLVFDATAYEWVMIFDPNASSPSIINIPGAAPVASGGFDAVAANQANFERCSREAREQN